MQLISTKTKCLSCGIEMRISKLSCDACHCHIEGRFAQQSEFSRLTADEIHFVRLFLFNEGKIKDVEKALGVSYPTVKALLNNINQKLFQDGAPQEVEQFVKKVKKSKTQEVLEKLSSGQITAENAIKIIKGEDDGNRD